MSRLETLQHIVGTKRGIITSSVSTLLFLLIMHFINGAPPLHYYTNNYESIYVIIQRLFTLITAILIGIITTITIYRVQHKTVNKEQGFITTVGSTLSIIGAGCAGCVAGVVPGLLATLGIGINFLALPLLGSEFLIVSTIVLSLTLYWMLKPVVCPLDLSSQEYIENSVPVKE